MTGKTPKPTPKPANKRLVLVTTADCDAALAEINDPATMRPRLVQWYNGLLAAGQIKKPIADLASAFDSQIKDACVSGVKAWKDQLEREAASKDRFFEDFEPEEEPEEPKTVEIRIRNYGLDPEEPIAGRQFKVYIQADGMQRHGMYFQFNGALYPGRVDDDMFAAYIPGEKSVAGRFAGLLVDPEGNESVNPFTLVIADAEPKPTPTPTPAPAAAAAHQTQETAKPSIEVLVNAVMAAAKEMQFIGSEANVKTYNNAVEALQKAYTVDQLKEYKNQLAQIASPNELTKVKINFLNGLVGGSWWSRLFSEGNAADFQTFMTKFFHGK